MKNVNKASNPLIEYRQEKHYLGIRTIVPFNGMFAAIDPSMKELRKWVKHQGIADQGPYLLRYHVIDMRGPMDLEVGFIVSSQLPGDERVRPGILPAGHYAQLIYSGGGLRGNKALLEWAAKNNIKLDRWDDIAGDAFACRYEAYLTDYRVEPRKMLWEIELAIKLADDQPATL